MDKISHQNKKAWSYNAYDFWVKELGRPEELAIEMISDPAYHLRRHIEYLGDVKGKKIVNPLGSCGKKSYPLGFAWRGCNHCRHLRIKQ